MSNNSLNSAILNRNNEFYTHKEDIGNIFYTSRKKLVGKIIHFNCDSPESNFYKVIEKLGYFYGIKEAYFTFYNPKLDKISLFDTEEDIAPKNEMHHFIFENEVPIHHIYYYEGSGDFRSEYCINITKKCDLVITNPPYSLMREFIDIIYKGLKKDIIIVAGIMIFTYINTFPLFMNRELKIVGKLKSFLTPSGETKEVPSYWISTLPILYKLKEIEFIAPSNEYKRLKEYNAIVVDRFKKIPDLKNEYLAVPLTLAEYNFEKYFIPIFYLRPVLKDGTAIFNRIIVKRK